MNDLRRHSQDPDEVATAMTVAAVAVDDGDPEAALPYLQWAKAAASRSPKVREALGVAYYLAERWGEALSELQAYRRLTGRSDNNHLVADCLRALGRPLPHIVEVVDEMDPSRDGADRVTEGVIVWASTVAERSGPAAGRAVLRDALRRQPVADPADHDLRLWYVAADLAERDADTDEAERWFGRVAAHAPDFHDTATRLARLRGEAQEG